MDDIHDSLRVIREGMRRHDADSLVDAVLHASRSGALPEGARLPTITVFAESLGLSATTVSRAWASLRQMGVIETNKRGGTRIARPTQATSYRTKAMEQSRFSHRLAAGYPDPALQVDLRWVLHKVAETAAFPGYPGKDAISDVLREALIARAGYRPEWIMLDAEVIGALPRVLQAVSHRGAAVGIGDPEFPLYPVILRQMGMSYPPIPFDERGYDLAAVESLLRAGVRVFLLQTRVHNPTGLGVPTANLQAIGELLRRYDGTAIEVDHHGQLAPEYDVRLASFAPERVVLLTSFAKDIHPDVRVSAIYGPHAILDRVSAWRAGGEWVSAINRAVLEVCLSDTSVDELIARARDEYAARRAVFHSAFEKSDLRIQSNAGLSLWVPVRSEQEALVHLAADGISVARGSAFAIGTKEREPHVHLSLGSVGPHASSLSARVLHAALQTPTESGFY